MGLGALLGVSSVYLALVGLGFLVAPDAIMFGTVGAGASAALIANLRGVSSTFFGIAVLNWVGRTAPPSPARNAIVLANTVGFAIAGVLDIAAATSGAPSAELAPAVINLLFAGAFAWAGRTTMGAATG